MKNLFKTHPTKSHNIPSNPTIISLLLYIYIISIHESEYDYLVDDNFGPADAYLFVITNWSNHIEHDLTPYPNIVALRNKVAERQSVQIAMRDEGLLA